MNNLARMVITWPGAFVMATGLALIMAKMIYVPFMDLPDKTEKLSFNVNAEISDDVIPKKQKPPKELIRVIPPPAVPIIEHSPTNKPTDSFIPSDYDPPTFDKPDIGPGDFTLIISDKEETPVLRFEPVMPSRAEKSGHCNVRFSVSAQGRPYEIETTYCSQAIFKRATIKAVAKWKYNPKIQDGIAVSRRGVQTLITFNLTDEYGQLITE